MSEERKLQEKEELLRQKLEKIHAMEQEIQEKEKNLRLREKSKKQIILRLSPTLWEEIARWADEDFRSINGQIEFLLTECVRQRKKSRNSKLLFQTGRSKGQGSTFARIVSVSV